jgi:hypothetical protein
VAGVAPVAAVVLLFALGVPLVASSLRLLIVRPPRLRATAEGLWFGGGSLVPWSEVKAIYQAGFNITMHGTRTKTSAVAIDFRRRRTLLRLPISLWLGSPFSVGDVDVSPHGSRTTTSVLVAQLDAMRTVALGTDDPAAPEELPAARLVSRD